MNAVEITWHPIETAPKDKGADGLTPRILLACYGGKEPTVCEGYWRPDLPDGGNGLAYKAGWVSSIDPNVWPEPYLHAQFWAPMPSPPVEPRYFRDGVREPVEGPLNETQAN